MDHGPEAKAEFHVSEGLTTAEAEKLLLQYGRNELPEKRTPSWRIFLDGLWGIMPGMLWAASIIEYALKNYPDGSILLAILFINATISWYETVKAGNAVAALKSSLKPIATVCRDGKWGNINSALLVPGDLVKLGAGSAVPADCRVNDHEIESDQSAMTGESLPVPLSKGMPALMGCTVVRGEADATVEHTGANTFFGRTATLLNEGGDGGGGKMRVVVLRVLLGLSGVSLLLTLICLIYLLARPHGESFHDALQFCIIVLVASIPLALEVVVTTTLALGARQLSKKEAIVSRLSAIEQLSGVNILCSDKTGTLTMNAMAIQDECPTFLDGLNRESVLVLAALATKWHEPARDALDTMVLNAVDKSECDKFTQISFTPFDPIYKRTSARLRNSDGTDFSVVKGAPHVIVELTHPTDHFRKKAMDTVTGFGLRGIRVLAVAKTANGPALTEEQAKAPRSAGKDAIFDQTGLPPYQLAGFLTFLDPPRPDTKRTVELAVENGVEVKMVTGDHVLIAKEMARLLNMGTHVLDPKSLPHDVDGKAKDLGDKYGALCEGANGFAQVHPEHKFLIVEALRQRGHTVAMTGDGVNDAPALKRADVGIAVQGATDAARAAADIVLTAPGLSTLIDALLISRSVFQRMRSFLVYRISATVQLLLFFFVSVFAFQPQDYDIPEAERAGSRLEGVPVVEYPPFFQLPVLLLMLITLLNDGCLLTIGYDNVKPPKHPMSWNTTTLFLVAVVMSLVALFSSLLLLWFGLHSTQDSSLFAKIGLPAMQYDHVVTMMYLKISISDFMTLFCSRTNDKFFWHSMPHPLLIGAATISLLISSMLASFWPAGVLDHVPIRGLAIGDGNHLMPLYVWLYSIFWWFIQDAVKVGLYRFLGHFQLFGYVPDNAHKPVEHVVTAQEVEAAAAVAKAEADAKPTLRDKKQARDKTITVLGEKAEDGGMFRVQSSAGMGEVYAYAHQAAGDTSASSLSLDKMAGSSDALHAMVTEQHPPTASTRGTHGHQIHTLTDQVAEEEEEDEDAPVLRIKKPAAAAAEPPAATAAAEQPETEVHKESEV